MRGLAFPNAVYNREASYDRDHGTPQRNNADAIPIDPALSGTAIDPAITGEESRINEVLVKTPEYYQQAREPQYSQGSRQYSQGPQGDPFAPQPPAPYLRIEEEPAPSSKPAKRKRRPRREEECGFCQGNDLKNKGGDAEPMVSCEECGRSGHPSCMELGEVSNVVRSYSWKCIECKICEICQEKGDDNRILFCDFCDRGWHMDCLRPPLEDSPPGRWHCPMCPQLVQGPDGMEYYPSPDQETQLLEDDEPEESMDPSSSQPHANTYNRKGKQKAVPTDDSDSDMDMDEGADGDSLVAPKSKRRKPYKKTRGKGGQNSGDDEVSSTAPGKRPRIHVTSPVASRPRMVVRLRLPPKGKGKGREDDDSQKGLFDDILGVDDRDTTKTAVEFGDKQRFEKSRLVTEEKLAPPPPPLPAPEVLHALHASSLYRPLRSSTLHHVNIPPAASTPGMSVSPAPSTPGPSLPASSPHLLRIRTIRFGEFDIQTWYDAPFPEEYATIPDGRLWICEFCLKYMKSRFGAVRHRMKCKARHPPGDEIYRDGAISVFEVDGRKNKIYCQNLCLLSKMFLDHKSLFYDVEPFLFYVMTEVDDTGARFVGYFSKEKRSPKDYNVSCIMTLPVRQRQGWGNLLIDFSYLLSKKEQRAGSPEKPLSGLGALGYKNYWTLALMRYLDSAPDKPSLEDISVATSMTIEDVHATLTQQNMISSREITPPPVRPSPGQSIKFPKGRKHGIARRHLQRTQTNDDVDSTPKPPFSAPRQYEIRWDREYVIEYLAAWGAKGYLKLKPEKLKWSPFLLARMKKTDGLLTTDSSAEVDPMDSIPVTANGPATPHNGARRPSESIFDDNAVASSSRESLNTHSQAREQDDECGTDLPIFDLQSDRKRSPSDELLDTPRTMRPRGRPISSTSGANHLNGDSAIHEPFAEGHRTRSESTRASELEHSLADDEALATKLALEERRSSRSLRTRPERTPDLRRTVSSTSATRSTSPRKRRRVESSPESETSSLLNVGTPVNGTALQQHSNGSTYSPRNQRKTSQLLNGSGTSHDTTVTLSLRKNGLPPSPISPTDQTLTTIKANDTFDIKSEVVTTPLTALTSRHSVDTVIVAETMDDKQRDGPGKAGPAETNDNELSDRDADADADEDLDAEGEIDAEGDLDVEVTF